MSNKTIALLFMIVTVFIPEGSVTAHENSPTIFYTNDNIVLVPHPEVASFNVMDIDTISGVTDNDGITFSQISINNDTTRLHRFQIQEAWWYVSDRGIIGYGEGISEIQALSIYLTLPELTG